MLPVIALVGRPNVGKSTLFNCLTRSRAALVANIPGLTRDRQYGEGKVGSYPFIVIDTGGIGEKLNPLQDLMSQQTQQAISEANLIFFMVEAKNGLTPVDRELAQALRTQHKKIILVVNKTDDLNNQLLVNEFHALGLGTPIPIAAAHQRGITALIEYALAEWPVISKEEGDSSIESLIKLAVVGRPNVGKSTLINRILGEERTVVFDAPGTTRDSIYIPFEREGQAYTLIDTAGVRRRSRIDEIVEKFSVVKTLQAIDQSHVVVMLIDASESVTEQDLKLLSLILQAGKGLVIALNKWDGLSSDQRETVKQQVARRLGFVDFARIFCISALHGSGVGDLFKEVKVVYEAASRTIKTGDLSELLAKAVVAHQPPMVKGRRIKLRYAHLGGRNPPTIIIHGNQTENLGEDYQRYLINYFREHLNLYGTAIHLVLKTTENPFKGRRNDLTPRQQRKKQRLLRFHRKKK